MIYEHQEFEVIGLTTDDNVYLDVEVTLTMVSPSEGRHLPHDSPDYVPAEFEVEKVKLYPTNGPKDAIFELTVSQFIWAYPHTEDIIVNALEWAARNEADFYDHES